SPARSDAHSESTDLKESASERRFSLALDGNQQCPRQLEEARLLRALRYCRWASPSGGRSSIPAACAGHIHVPYESVRRKCYAPPEIRLPVSFARLFCRRFFSARLRAHGAVS